MEFGRPMLLAWEDARCRSTALPQHEPCSMHTKVRGAHHRVARI